jgi:hypothetical protein
MSILLRNLWKDQCGAMLLHDWVFLAMILVLGMLPALAAAKNRSDALGNSRERLEWKAEGRLMSPAHQP